MSDLRGDWGVWGRSYQLVLCRSTFLAPNDAFWRRMKSVYCFLLLALVLAPASCYIPSCFLRTAPQESKTVCSAMSRRGFALGAGFTGKHARGELCFVAGLMGVEWEAQQGRMGARMEFGTHEDVRARKGREKVETRAPTCQYLPSTSSHCRKGRLPSCMLAIPNSSYPSPVHPSACQNGRHPHRGARLCTGPPLPRVLH